ncbi:hypothetical protein [Streptomyces sp. NPDC020817]
MYGIEVCVDVGGTFRIVDRAVGADLALVRRPFSLTTSGRAG